jgi:GNAT superfamily N-acetyltransferase
MDTAIMGYDLHTHGVTSQCTSSCIARGPGRYLQFVSLQGLDRRTGFQLIKNIDGRPKVNGSDLVWSLRLGHFRGGFNDRQSFYEAIGDADELLRLLLVKEQLPHSRLPPVRNDNHILAVEIFESAHTSIDGAFHHPRHDEPSGGLHAVAVESYDESTETIQFWNSWGSGWGQGGYGQMSLQYARDFYYDAVVIRYARWGPISAKVDRMENANDPKEYRRLWAIENPRSIEHISGPNSRTWRHRRYETISPKSGKPVACHEVTTGFGLCVGWAFVELESGDNKAVVTEIFVWPSYRRLGIGRFLENACVEEALKKRSSMLELVVNEADSVVGPPRTLARRFLASCGYECRWRNRTGPRSSLTGVKTI